MKHLETPRFKPRISRSVAAQMITVAFMFDLMQLIPKMLFFVSMAAVGLVAWVPIFGQVLAVAAVGIGTAVDMALGGAIAGTGYFTLWTWFQQRDVSIMRGNRIGRKTLTLMLTFVLELLPFLNTLPSVTIWTTSTIYFSRLEDKEKHARMVRSLRAKALIAERRLRQRAQYELRMAQERRQIAAYTQAPTLAAANDNEPHRSTAPLAREYPLGASYPRPHAA